MGMLNLVISYDGKWDSNNRYVDSSFIEVLVDDTLSYLNVLEIVYEKLRLDPAREVKLMVSFDIGTSTYSILEVKGDDDLIWYFNSLRNSNLFKFPLIVFVGNQLLALQEVFEPHDEGDSSLIAYSSKCNRNKNCVEATDVLNIEDINEGDVFFSKLDVQNFLHLLAMKRNFQFQTLKSNGERLVVACKVDGCKWYVRASTISSTRVWVIRCYERDHSCAVDVVHGDHRQATSLIISECVKERFIDGECINPKAIMKHMRKEFGVGVSYYKSWRAKELVLEAIQGSPEESYAQLPSLCYALITTNPGTVSAIEDGGNGHFKYFFLSFAASIQGWSHCRPVISVDGTFLRNKYMGTLLIACTMDGNNSIFPLAFAVVDSETDASWEWFLYKLKGAICHRDDLVFVSDRKSSIPKAVSKVFPDAIHCVCVQHLLGNIRTKFKHPSLATIFNRCARVYKFVDFEHEMQKLDQLAPGIRDYLRDISYEKWSRCYSMRRRYDIMTSNISESMNSVLDDARELPIIPLIEYIRKKLQEWFYARRMEANSLSSLLTPWAEKHLSEQIVLGRHMEVEPNDVNEMTVVHGKCNFIVHLETRRCSCRMWDFEEIPCAHACAAISKQRLCAYNFVSKYYTKYAYGCTYEATIHSLGNQCDWVVPNEILEDNLMPPETKRSAGRPKKTRIPSVGEFKKTVRCSRCGQFGHNKATCKNHIRFGLSTPKKQKGAVGCASSG